jgi:hypothetical protein
VIRGADHLAHLGLMQAEGIIERVANLPVEMPDDAAETMVLALHASLFLSGVEFTLRMARRYPQHVDELIDWCNAHADSDGQPLEIRERDMADHARQVMEGCS